MQCISLCVFLTPGLLWAGEADDGPDPDTMTFSTAKIKQESQRPRLSIEVVYPQVTILERDELRSAQFNALIKKFVTDRVNKFRSTYSQSIKKKSDGLPEKCNYYQLHIGYDLTAIDPIKYVSVRFDESSFTACSAHPEHKQYAINYDLRHNQQLKLADLFKTDSNYLEKVAQYCQMKLSKKLSSAFEPRGVAPLPENYQVWSVGRNGLWLTFPEYQVAPYALGPQEVIIPFRQIVDLANPKKSIIGCIRNTITCSYPVRAASATDDASGPSISAYVESEDEDDDSDDDVAEGAVDNSALDAVATAPINGPEFN